MNIRLSILILLLIPILVAGGFALTHKPMNAPVIAILGAVMIWLGYTGYARRIDQNVIQPDAKKATPARMYMDGVDFMPTSRNVLYGYHFKSIAAAGPIVGPIAAVALWGWLPCGLVYSLLATALISGGAANGSMVMLSFGLGTFPAMLMMGGTFSPSIHAATDSYFRCGLSEGTVI